MDRDSYSVFNPKDPRLKMYVKLFDGIVLSLNLGTCCSSLTYTDSMVGAYSAVLRLRFLLMLWSVRILDTKYVLEYCFGCSLPPGMQLNSPCKLASSVLLWSLTLPIQARHLWLPRPYAWPSSTYPQCRNSAFLAMVTKLARLSFRGRWPHWFRRDNGSCPGLMLDSLQPIPDTEYLPFDSW